MLLSFASAKLLFFQTPATDSGRNCIFTRKFTLFDMNTEKFFTDDEKILFFSKYRILRRALAESLEHDDPQKIRRLLRPVAAVDCYGRDRNGINGLLRNVETALIAAVDIGLKRAAVIALILYRPVLKKAVALEDVERAFGHDTALIIDRLLKTSDLYARNTAAGS